MQYPTDVQPSALRAPRFDGTQACAGASIDLFFPPPGNRGRLAVRQAKALCGGCRFQDACLTYAIDAQGVGGLYVDGVWGGTTAAERTALRVGRGHLRHVRAAS